MRRRVGPRHSRTALGAFRERLAHVRRLEAGGADARELAAAERELEALLPAAIDELSLSSDSGLSREALAALLRGRS